MAAPTPTTYSRQVGHHGYTAWTALWANSDNFTDTVIVDVSGLTTYNNAVKIKKLSLESTTGIGVTLEFDASTDQLIARSPVGNSSIVSLDFTENSDYGLVKTATGATGDIILSTDSAASADEVILHIWWYAN